MSGKEKTMNLVLYECVYLYACMYVYIYVCMYVCARESAIYFLYRLFYVPWSILF